MFTIIVVHQLPTILNGRLMGKENVSIVQSFHHTTNFATRRRVKQAQTIIEPSACLPVGTGHFGSNCSPGVLQTIGDKKVEFSLVGRDNTPKNFIASRAFLNHFPRLILLLDRTVWLDFELSRHVKIFVVDFRSRPSLLMLIFVSRA